MEFRVEKAALAVLMLAGPLAAELRYDVRHDHLLKGGTGTLSVAADGISFAETGKAKHAWQWRWEDIEQLQVFPKTVIVLTYRDNPWKLGADREYRFDLSGGKSDFSETYRLLKDRLDQRFVAALADPRVRGEWQLPVKRLTRFGGSRGVLLVGADRIVYRTAAEGESRTWRLRDIENVSRSGPFDLTFTTYERAGTHYGSLKGFRFQLRQPLDEARYNRLWRAVNRANGLQVLSSDEESKP